MANKMLIDASHPEETRVVVVRGNRIEEFDFESQDKKQLKGNIYLARVTRVEPSLQAAFVEYGGNRHGFLAFSEIHPDYYQIPMADRQALLRAEAEDAEDEDDDHGEGEDSHDRGRGRRRRRNGKARGSESHGVDAGENGAGNGEADSVDANAEVVDANDENGAAAEGAVEADRDQAGEADTPVMTAAVDAHVVSGELVASQEQTEDAPSSEEHRGTVEEVPASRGDGGDESEVESVGAEDALEEVRSRRRPMRRQYKIQEVIKRRQILLVQVVKEERGNKGAALTTYLSLAGRYSVLMPNTARGGGISRKITNVQDRKRLKEIVQELEVPTGMGVILRTAGESRTKAEIKRDYEYLMRLWENVRNLTLSSIAPALVYEEGSLIKRSVRDLYNKDIDEILVSGEDAYREAKDFMRMLMPSHAKVVQPYRDTTPIFARNGIEAQLDKMLQPQVTLKSGGYIIINQTEALVSIDVNSGRSTKEHSIEDTALQTNLEAAEEVARQLRLRDLAGLIVIDFIDMEENRNNRAVEKKLKECLKNDRARIQVGRISHFGLLEMSRQRIRASVLESTTKPCPHCGGTGHVRSESSVALLVVRAIEEFLLKDSRNHITVRAPVSTALYVLNHKRSTLVELEKRFGLTITLEADDSVGAQHYVIARGAVAEKPQIIAEPAPVTTLVEPEDLESDVTEAEIIEEEEEADAQGQAHSHHDEGAHRDRKRKRRRRRRGGRDRDREHMPTREQSAESESEAAAVTEGAEVISAAEDVSDDDQSLAAADEAAENSERKKRRRGKRGGRRNRTEHGEVDAADEAVAAEAESDETETAEQEVAEAQAVEAEPVAAETSAEEVAPLADEAAAAAAELVADAPAADAESAAKPKARRTTRSKKAAAAEATESADVTTAPEAKPKKPRASRKKVVEPEASAAAEPEQVIAHSEEPATAGIEPVTVQTEAKPAQSAPEAVPSNSDSDSDASEAAKAEDASAEKQNEPAEALVSSSVPAAPDAPKKGGWWQRKGFF